MASKKQPQEEQMFPMTEAEKRGIIHRNLQDKTDDCRTKMNAAEDALRGKKKDYEEAAALLKTFEEMMDAAELQALLGPAVKPGEEAEQEVTDGEG